MEQGAESPHSKGRWSAGQLRRKIKAWARRLACSLMGGGGEGPKAEEEMGRRHLRERRPPPQSSHRPRDSGARCPAQTKQHAHAHAEREREREEGTVGCFGVEMGVSAGSSCLSIESIRARNSVLVALAAIAKPYGRIILEPNSQILFFFFFFFSPVFFLLAPCSAASLGLVGELLCEACQARSLPSSTPRRRPRCFAPTPAPLRKG